MSNFFKNGSKTPTGTNLPSLRPTGSPSLSSITAAKNMLAKTSVAKDSVTISSLGNQSTGSSLGALSEAKKMAEEHRQRPFLVYFMLDLTMSRSDTRAAMVRYEKDIAKLVMESGGKHPVLCKGVYFKGNYCSQPQTLANAEEVQSFFALHPEAGGTRIKQALTHYKNDSTDAVLSLGILIGDTADSDRQSDLMELAEKMNSDNSSRPIVIAYEQTQDLYSADFCQTQAPALAKACGGHSFGLSEYPTELIALLGGYKKILTATPEQLKEAVKPHMSGAAGDIFSRLSPKGREFMVNQAKRLVVPLLGGPEQKA